MRSARPAAAIYLASAGAFAPLRRTVRWAALGHLSRLALGCVRWRSGGLLLAILAHVCADATILAIRIGKG